MRPAPPQAPRPRVPVDPRIRERRVQVRRSEGRRRLVVVTGVLSVAAVVASGWGATRSPLLDVDRVLVDGAAHAGAPAVVAAAALGPRSAMVDVDEEAVARRVSELPWVLRARARREWPATVRISVVERTAVAVTRDDGGGWAVVDVSGRVLEREPGPPEGLTALEGAPPAGQPGTRLDPAAAGGLLVAGALGANLAPRVEAVALVAEGVELRLRPGGVVRMGPPEGLEEKLRAVRTVLANVDPHTLATLDVRHSAAPVLTRR